ncbi:MULTISPECIES: hypothetical protein [Streptomyces]|uniref:hypothetical protein n=1 Tax=Streptomyces TaxID=1883 RepID=UPI00131D946E
MPKPMITATFADAFTVRTSSSTAATQPTNSTSRARDLSSGVRNCRTVPPRRQTHSITPTVNGVRKSRTTEAVIAFSSSSVKSKPPSRKV